MSKNTAKDPHNGFIINTNDNTFKLNNQIFGEPFKYNNHMKIDWPDTLNVPEELPVTRLDNDWSLKGDTILVHLPCLENVTPIGCVKCKEPIPIEVQRMALARIMVDKVKA